MVPGIGDHIGSDGISLHIKKGGQIVLLVQWTGEGAPLKQVSPLAHPEVDGSSVEAMRLANGFAETILALGNGNEMNMIVHQDVGSEMQTVHQAVMMHKLQVIDSILGTEEDPHGSNTSLGDVVGNTWNNDTCHASHASSWNCSQ
jgi:hypothetical protein